MPQYHNTSKIDNLWYQAWIRYKPNRVVPIRFGLSTLVQFQFGTDLKLPEYDVFLDSCLITGSELTTIYLAC